MKKIAMIVCFIVLIMTMTACNPGVSNPEKSNGSNASTEMETGSLHTSNQVSWLNLNVDTKGLSERERIVVDYFDNNYLFVNDFISFSKYANIYENARIKFAPLVIAKILNSDKESYEAIAINPGYNDDFNDYNLDGKNLVYLMGGQMI